MSSTLSQPSTGCQSGEKIIQWRLIYNTSFVPNLVEHPILGLLGVKSKSIIFITAFNWQVEILPGGLWQRAHKILSSLKLIE